MKFIALNRESTMDGLCLKLAGYIESDWYNEEELTNKLNESSLIKYKKKISYFIQYMIIQFRMILRNLCI